MNPQAATGDDDVTWEDYGRDLMSRCWHRRSVSSPQDGNRPAFKVSVKTGLAHSTTRIDIFTNGLLTVLVALRCWMTFAHNLASNAPYNYRDSVGVWWRSLFDLQPDVNAVPHAPTVYQLHAIIAWLFWASFPFTRLVHAWSIPLQYIGRPYILYRRRFQTARRPA